MGCNNGNFEHPFDLNVSSGALSPSYKQVYKFGQNAVVGNSMETIWQQGGLYSYPPSASTMTVSSSNVNDTSAGTGARTVRVREVTDGWIPQEPVNYTMNGTTPVNINQTEQYICLDSTGGIQIRNTLSSSPTYTLAGLTNPSFALQILNNNYFIADQGNNQVLEVSEDLATTVNTIAVTTPIFLDYDDGFLRENIGELKKKLVYWFRKLKPNWIITFDPWKKYEIHPDHIEIGRMASEAAVFSCFPLLYPEHLKEGLEPHQPDEVWYMTPMEQKPNRLVDITETFKKKIKAILCHQSQVEMLADMFVKGADPKNLTSEQKSQLTEGTTTLLQMASTALGTLSEGKVELAEAFYVLKVAAGHFDNYQDFVQEMIGMDPDSLKIF